MSNQTTAALLLAQGIEQIRTALGCALVDGPVAILVPPGGTRALEARFSYELHGALKRDPDYANGRLIIAGVEVRDA